MQVVQLANSQALMQVAQPERTRVESRSPESTTGIDNRACTAFTVVNDYESRSPFVQRRIVGGIIRELTLCLIDEKKALDHDSAFIWLQTSLCPCHCPGHGTKSAAAGVSVAASIASSRLASSKGPVPVPHPI